MKMQFNYEVFTRKEAEKLAWRTICSFKKDVKFFVRTPYNWLGFKTQEQADKYVKCKAA